MKKLFCLFLGLLLTGSCFACETHYLNITVPKLASVPVINKIVIPTDAVLKNAKIIMPQAYPNIPNTPSGAIDFILLDSNSNEIQKINTFIINPNNLSTIMKKTINVDLKNIYAEKNDQLEIINYSTDGSSNSFMSYIREHITIEIDTK